MTGLFGVGGGFLIIPVLVLMLGIEMSVAVGTSLVIIVANSVAGLASHLSGTSIDWSITLAFAGTAIVGSLLAAHLGTRFDTGRCNACSPTSSLQWPPMSSSTRHF